MTQSEGMLLRALFREKLLLFFIIIFVGVYTTITFCLYRAFEYHDFDLAIFAHALWKILHGSIDNSILGVPFLANHANLILFPLAPLYLVWSSPKFLLFLQALATAVAVYPVYYYAKFDQEKKLALAWAAAWFLYPANSNALLYEFHPVVLAIPCIAAACYYFEKERFKPFLIFSLIGIACQEDVPLVVFMFGFLSLIRHRRGKWVWAPFMAGFAAFVLMAGVVIPHYNKETLGFLNLYKHLGDDLVGVVTSPVLHPFRTGKYLFTAENGLFMLQLLVPTAFLALAGADVLILAVPMLLQHLLSARSTEHTILYHYTATISPIVLFAAVVGTRRITGRLRTVRWRWVLTALVMSMTMFSLWLFWPVMRLPMCLETMFRDDLDWKKETIVAQVPQDAPVMATFAYLGRLANREHIYSFHHIYRGTYTLSTKQYEPPTNVQFCLIDFNDQLMFFMTPHSEEPREHVGEENMRAFFDTAQWGVVDAAESVVLLEAGKTDAPYLYEYMSPPNSARKLNVIFGGNVELVAYKMDNRSPIYGETLPIAFYWRPLEKLNADLYGFVRIYDVTGKEIKDILRPICYRVLPTSQWEPDAVLRENYWLLYPGGIPPGTYYVGTGLYNPSSGEPLPAQGELLRDKFSADLDKIVITPP